MLRDARIRLEGKLEVVEQATAALNRAARLFRTAEAEALALVEPGTPPGLSTAVAAVTELAAAEPELGRIIAAFETARRRVRDLLGARLRKLGLEPRASLRSAVEALRAEGPVQTFTIGRWGAVPALIFLVPLGFLGSQWLSVEDHCRQTASTCAAGLPATCSDQHVGCERLEPCVSDLHEGLAFATTLCAGLGVLGARSLRSVRVTLTRRQLIARGRRLRLSEVSGVRVDVFRHVLVIGMRDGRPVTFRTGAANMSEDFVEALRAHGVQVG